jgi:hypothetical protein
MRSRSSQSSGFLCLSYVKAGNETRRIESPRGPLLASGMSISLSPLPSQALLAQVWPIVCVLFATRYGYECKLLRRDKRPGCKLMACYKRSGSNLYHHRCTHTHTHDLYLIYISPRALRTGDQDACHSHLPPCHGGGNSKHPGMI